MAAHGAAPVFLTAEWRHLAMLSYEVDPHLLVKLIPAGTELDRWNGKVFVSLVGFRFLNTKVFGVPIPFHRNFDEVNLRFYVRRWGGSELRRGVVFIREIVPRWGVAVVARTLYNENYVALPMSHSIARSGEAITAEYRWRSGDDWSRMDLTALGDPALPREGSHEQFITEHFWGYATQRDGSCKEYRVVHDSWKVWRAETASVGGELEEVYGTELAGVLKSRPASALLAEGSAVTVHQGKRIS